MGIKTFTPARQIVGRVWRLIENAELFMFQQVRPLTIFGAATEADKIFSQIVYWLWMRVPEKDYGTSKQHTTICGTEIYPHRRT